MAKRSSFSCVVLLVALVLLSAASIGHAQKTGVGIGSGFPVFGPYGGRQAQVGGRLLCTADGNPMMNGTQSNGAAGVNVTLSCRQGDQQGHRVDVAAAVTDSKGMFNITADVSDRGGLLGALLGGRCDVKVDLPVSNSSSCNRLPQKGQLRAQVTVLSTIANILHAVIRLFQLQVIV